MPSSVAALFTSKVRKLPPPAIEMLEYCACMGNRFSPTEISLAKGLSLLETFEILKPALALRLLMESGDDLQFVHDRVQEAVLGVIDPQRRSAIHWNIGNHLLSLVSQAAGLEKMDNLFALAAHLNLGRPKICDVPTAYLLSNINYCAGEKALEALATEAANEYFRFARELLPPDCWETQYARTFKIYQEAKP